MWWENGCVWRHFLSSLFYWTCSIVAVVKTIDLWLHLHIVTSSAVCVSDRNNSCNVNYFHFLMRYHHYMDYSEWVHQNKQIDESRCKLCSFIFCTCNWHHIKLIVFVFLHFSLRYILLLSCRMSFPCLCTFVVVCFSSSPSVCLSSSMLQFSSQSDGPCRFCSSLLCCITLAAPWGFSFRPAFCRSVHLYTRSPLM